MIFSYHRCFLFKWIFALFFVSTFYLWAGPEQLQNHLLIIYNKNFPESESLARYYARKRQIPDEKLLGLRCDNSEEINRASYESTILNPAREFLIKKGWLQLADGTTSPQENPAGQPAIKNDIWAIVLMRGIPLKIANDESRSDTQVPNPVLKTNAASVDSELATLPSKNSAITGYIPNPYFSNGLDHEFDEIDAEKMILVTRLDGPTEADVKRMIDESFDTEAHRLLGTVCIDTQGKIDPKEGYFTGDEWLRLCKGAFQANGFAVEFDDHPELFADNLPWSHIAFYAGWYSDHAQGFFFREPRRFNPGAIAYHIHSFSAATVRNPKENWVAPLISAGASAVIGSVYEPYLALMTHPDIFARALLQGYTFAEASYLSQPALSWMMTFVGDPLYRPFRLSLNDALALTEKDSKEHDWLAIQQLRYQIKTGTFKSPTAAKIQKELISNTLDPIIWEGIGDLIKEFSLDPTGHEIANDWQRAFDLTADALDQIRISLKLAAFYSQLGETKKAMALLETVNQRYPDESAFYGVKEALKSLKNSPTAPLAVPRISSSANDDQSLAVPKPPQPPQAPEEIQD